jgi:hypothetical protein
MRSELKARVKEMAEDQRGRRQAKYEAMAEAKENPPFPEGWEANGYRSETPYWKTDWWKIQMRVNGLHWERHGYREDNRVLLLAYGFLKGRTYKQVENHHREGNEPDLGWAEGILSDWDRYDDVDLAEWYAAGDKTRFDLMPQESSEEAA